VCVCGDGWFNLSALISQQYTTGVQPHPAASESNQPDWGQVRPLKPATKHTHIECVCLVAGLSGLTWVVYSIYTYIHTYIHIYTHVHTHIYTYIHIYTHVHTGWGIITRQCYRYNCGVNVSNPRCSVAGRIGAK